MKFKEYLGESKPSESTYKRLAKMTDENRHTERVHAMAKISGHKEHIEAAAKLKKLHDKQGHITSEQIAHRAELQKNIMAKIKEKHGQEVHDKIYQTG